MKQVELSREYWLDQTANTIKSEIALARGMRDTYREQLELAIQSGNEDNASRYARPLTRQTRIIALISDVILTVTK